MVRTNFQADDVEPGALLLALVGGGVVLPVLTEPGPLHARSAPYNANKLRAAAKKVIFYSGPAIKSKGLATKKKNFFEALKEIAPKNGTTKLEGGRGGNGLSDRATKKNIFLLWLLYPALKSLEKYQFLN